MENSIREKISEIEDKINNFSNNKLLRDSSKKLSLLKLKIEEQLDNILETIEDFELNDINDYQIDKEIETRIEEFNFTKEIIDVFGPYILIYQLSRNSL